MNIRPVLLISDGLFFLLIAAAIAALWYASKKEHLRRAWHAVLSDRMAMAMLAILIVYLSIAILDSLHFRRALDAVPTQGTSAHTVNYAVEVESALDALLHDMKEDREKTYSAPFAHTLFERQTIETADGRRLREYPRLTYGAAYLHDPVNEKSADIVMKLGAGLLLAVLIWLALWMLIAWSVAHRKRAEAAAARELRETDGALNNANVAFASTLRHVMRGDTAIAWNGFLVAAGVLLALLVPLFVLSHSYHVLGTDRTGNDVFFYALKAMRTALFIGTLTSLVVLPLGVILGITAGYFGGWIDDVIQYIYTVISSIPYVLLIAASVLLLQVVLETHATDWFDTPAARADARLVALCAIIGAISWTTLCRLMRAETFKLRETDYVQAARAFGVSSLRIMLRHILPNAFHIVLITMVLDFSSLVLAEAVLAYIGIGVDPNTISYGTMINSARSELAREPMVWWQIAAAFIFMLALVLAANLFADAVRDAFDPRGQTALKRRWRAA